MAEALARHSASDVIEPSSAGIAPLGEIARLTEAVLKERGVPIEGQYSKGLFDEELETPDLIINMTGRPGRDLFPPDKKKVEDWDVRDPYGEDIEIHRRICDEIEARLLDLANRLRRKQAEAGQT